MSLQETISNQLKVIADKADLFPDLNDALVLGGMVVLSLIGLFITTVWLQGSHLYWTIIVPVFAIISLVTQWPRLRGEETKWIQLLRAQLFHWIGLLAAIQLAYMMVRMGRLSYEATGFVVLLLVTFTVFLQGVYVDWRFYLVGLFLAVCLVLAMYITAYLWIILLLAVVFVFVGMKFVKYYGSRGKPAA
ncbi:MAG: hypothetical protein ACREX3_06490 [Gammaproteobacteria bacterium]